MLLSSILSKYKIGHNRAFLLVGVWLLDLSAISCFLFSGSEVVTVREFDWLKTGLETGRDNKFQLRQIIDTLAIDA